MMRFLRYSFDREPVAAMSCVIGVFALSLPLIVIPIRREMGYPTYQYDGPSLPVQASTATLHSPMVPVSRFTESFKMTTKMNSNKEDLSIN